MLKNVAKDYDIIVVHHSALAIQLCYVYLKHIYPNKKYVYTAHSCYESKYMKYKNPLKCLLRSYIQKKSLNISNRYIFVSKAGKKSYMNSFNIPDELTRVIYNGISLENRQLSLDKDTIWNIDDIRITYIGRLVEVKGVQYLLEAIRMIKNMGIKCSVKICGDGEYRHNLEQLSQMYEIDNIVSFEGIQRDIGKYLSNTDIFVYPSVCEEVFGISLVEALSYGVPCVAFNVGGIPEIIENHKNGIISEEKTSTALCNAILQLFNLYLNGDIRDMKEYCIQSAKKFSIENTINNLNKCYMELMK